MKIDGTTITLDAGESIDLVTSAGTTPLSTITVKAAAVVPPNPSPNLVRIGSAFPMKSLDDVDLNAMPNTVYMLSAGETINCTKKQVIKSPGVTITSPASAPAIIDFTNGAGSKEFQLSVETPATDFVLQSVTVRGNHNAVFLRSWAAKRLSVRSVYGDNTGIYLSEGGSEDVTIDGCSTSKQGRYAVYFGGTSNVRVNITKCNFGKSAQEHSMRCYWLIDSLIEDCTLLNRGGAPGKQGLKVHAGSNVTIRRCQIDGNSFAARFGADVNDPAGYTLGLYVTETKFLNAVKIDPGSTVAIDGGQTLATESGYVYSVDSKGKLSLHNNAATYAGGSFASGKVDTYAGGNTFNGKPV